MIKIILLFLAFTFGTCTEVQLGPGCRLCHHIMEQVQKHTPKKPLLPLLENIALKVCIVKDIQDKNVCLGAIKQMAPYILAGYWRHFTNPHLVCQAIKFCSKEYIKRNLKSDIQRITKDKPNKQWEQPTNRRKLKIMHISDLHPDLFYSEGSPVKCTEPVCCRANATALKDSPRAGYWGSVGDCDLPLQTFDLFIKEAIQHSPDAIIWTGDNTPHDIWQQTQSYNLNFTTILSQRLAKIKTTVIPAMGNHESYPVNVYDHHSQREQVLNAGLAQAWSHWLDQRAIKMQREKGYYSMSYGQLNNLKVLSVNTQAANSDNWLLLQDPSDPGDMLAWIEEELKESEKTGQIVYIIGHIPINDNLNDWSMRFNALVDRYSYIVRGQFYGHTHADEISFFPSMKSSGNIKNADLVGFNLVAPSLTTYSDRIPEYRIMQVDFDTLQLIDYKQYRFDVRKFTSKQQKVSFDLFYSFKEAYGLDDMSIRGGITTLRNKFRDDPVFRKLYSQKRCGGICEGSQDKKIFCEMTSSPQFEAQCNGNQFQKSTFEKIAGPWREWKHKL